MDSRSSPPPSESGSGQPNPTGRTPKSPESPPSSLTRELVLVSVVLAVPLTIFAIRRNNLRAISARMTHLAETQQVAFRQASLLQDRELTALRKELAELRKIVERTRRDTEALRAREVTANKEPPFARLSPRTLDEVAGAFVDVAAFIEEVETMEGLERRGNDPRGVHRLRTLAMRLHASAQANGKDARNPDE